MPDEKRAAVLAGHIVSPVSTKIQQTRQRLASLEGNIYLSSDETALQAIPVQVGGLHPITDLWYIESISTPNPALELSLIRLKRSLCMSAPQAGS
ncbi:hypothetical protein P4117_13760 [Pseudomonas aeruginosa]|nr:hypothetical protein [Pseudomonas aeruginosa]